MNFVTQKWLPHPIYCMPCAIPRSKRICDIQIILWLLKMNAVKKYMIENMSVSIMKFHYIYTASRHNCAHGAVYCKPATGNIPMIYFKVMHISGRYLNKPQHVVYRLLFSTGITTMCDNEKSQQGRQKRYY